MPGNDPILLVDASLFDRAAHVLTDAIVELVNVAPDTPEGLACCAQVAQLWERLVHVVITEERGLVQ